MYIPDIQLQFVDVAGSLYFQCEQGRPSAITVSLKKSDNTDLDTAVDGENILSSLSTVNTTLSATAAKGDTSITVTSATGITREDDILIGAGDLREWHKVASVASTTVGLYRPLQGPHASASSVAKTHVSVSVIAGNNDDVDNYRRARWTYTVSGISYRVDTLYHVVYHQFNCPVTTETLYFYDPNLSNYQHAEQKDFSKQIVAATKLVSRRLLDRGMNINNLLNDQAAELAIVHATFFILSQAWSMADSGLADWRDKMKLRMEEEIDSLVAHPGWYERDDQDLVLDSDESTGEPQYLGLA